MTRGALTILDARSQGRATQAVRRALSAIMPGHSRPKDGVASFAYVPASTSYLFLIELKKENVDGRDKPGHDVLRESHHQLHCRPREGGDP